MENSTIDNTISEATIKKSWFPVVEGARLIHNRSTQDQRNAAAVVTAATPGAHLLRATRPNPLTANNRKKSVPLKILYRGEG